MIELIDACGNLQEGDSGGKEQVLQRRRVAQVLELLELLELSRASPFRLESVDSQVS